ncbi:hypothetical protein ARMGADRAFT_299280 [Armillaria gallica]|uniref:Uncharacterized protein n=1 Tax=Armillaria gallica TaxID=47427 RepID=A0A2H3D5J0_ARMGA|nr:hypothetical protein ARMGADRAFT_299280 [Armillaria gallica]
MLLWDSGAAEKDIMSRGMGLSMDVGTKEDRDRDAVVSFLFFFPPRRRGSSSSLPILPHRECPQQASPMRPAAATADGKGCSWSEDPIPTDEKKSCAWS